MSPAICCICSISSLQQGISDWVIALVWPLFLLCCTTLRAPGLRSLSTLLSTDQERVCSSFLFPSEQLSRITPSQRSFLKVVRQKYLFSYPLSLSLAYPLPLWSLS